MQMKYVIIDNTWPILFPGNFEHSKFKEIGTITSAGFYKEIDGEIKTYGSSFSLKLSPAETDDWLIEKLYKGGE